MEKYGITMRNSGLPGSDTQKPSTYSAVAMTEQLVIQHLKQCRDLTRGFAYRVFPNFWRQWCKQILEIAEQAKTNKEQVALYEMQNLIAAVQQAAEQEFCQHLANGFVKFKNKSLNTLTGEERFSGDILSLVEHSDLEETIAITSITHRADNFFAEHLWAFQQRISLLNDGEKVDERANPVSPVQFCESLRKLLSNLDVDVKTKIIGYKLFDQDVIGVLDELYAELNDYLVRQNLLPNLRFVPANNEKPVGHKAEEVVADDPFESAPAAVVNEEQAEEDAQLHQRRASDKLLSGALNPNDIQYQNSLLNAIRLLQAHVTQQLPAVQATQALHAASGNAGAAPTAAPVAVPASLQVYSQPQLVGVLEHMQTQALSYTQQALASHETGPVAIPIQNVADVGRKMMETIASENENGAVEAGDMQTIDLVGMLFEYMLSDDHLPDSVKALLSYLHTPFLKIAFIDKGFFEQPEHPARVLLNSLAEAGVRWVSNDGSDQYDIFTKIKTTVFRLLQDFKNDVRLFAELLIEFNAYTHNVARRQELMERRALEKAQGEEKLREAKIQVNNEVRSRTDNREMPSAILLLLLQPWSDFLSFILLRYGDKSDSWKRALQVIDDLLWSIEPKTKQPDKVKQMEVQDELLKALQRGFETIGYEQAKGRKLLDAVTSLQRMALLSRKAEPAPAPMRTKLESLAAEKAGHAAEQSQPISPEEEKIVESLKMVEFGTWFEFEGGKRLKVAWYNKKTQHYMLVDQQGRKVSLAAGLQLARDMLAGRAKIIAGSTKPFFERALENIYHTLSERADTTLKTGS
ncbi:MAG: cell division protein FtsZ [Cellvibrio sp. 79]|nr:MAG: cell division protein FtsZ [Cellvibrio sp. 79]